MRTSRSSTVRGGHRDPPGQRPQLDRDPCPLDRDPHPDRDPPARKPLDRDLPWTETPPPHHLEQNHRQV